MRRDAIERIEPSRELDLLASQVVDAAVEVHRALGPGFLEIIYEEALSIELERRRIPFQRQVSLPVTYKGCRIGEGRADLVVGGQLIVELKAVEALLPLHVAQVISYLRASGRSLAILMTFNVKLLREGIRRVTLSPR